ncbi:MAG: enoyl-CoA hydratase/isomerase family protein [Chloroflexi bacterium]|nr:enoyl-CoA hydratase/isomerase family protein [Chloroflexota bacterium]
MSFENILYDKGNAVARIIINRPPYNVLDIKTTSEMNVAFDDASGDNAVKAIVVTASGNKAFSAGVDVRDHSPDKMDDMLANFDKLCYNLLSSEKPTIAVVNGVALGGGCEVAISCDMVIASEKSQFGQPEIKVGVYPSVAVALFPRMVPWKIALELLLTGDNISAAEAKSIGLANVVVPEEELDTAVEKFLARLTDKSLAILRATKRAYLRSLDLGVKDSLDTLEDDYKNDLMKTEDAVEGISAFLERRKPVWRDR